MYKTLTAMTAGIFTALITSAVIENYLEATPAPDSALTGSFGTGEWYQVDYADLAVAGLFGILFFGSYYMGGRRRKGADGSRWFRTFAGAAFATSVAVIFAKMIRGSSTLENINRSNPQLNNGIYMRNNIRPLANYNYQQAVNTTSGCNCGM